MASNSSKAAAFSSPVALAFHDVRELFLFFPFFFFFPFPFLLNSPSTYTELQIGWCVWGVHWSIGRVKYRRYPKGYFQIHFFLSHVVDVWLSYRKKKKTRKTKIGRNPLPLPTPSYHLPGAKRPHPKNLATQSCSNENNAFLYFFGGGGV